MTRLMSRLAVALLAAAPAFAEDAPKDAPAKAVVKEKRFSPEFEDAPLHEVLEFLTREAGFEYDLTKDAQALSKKGTRTVRVVAKDITAREVLDMALAQLDLSWAEKVAGQIRIMSSDEYVKNAVLELYDVRELLNPIVDFAGPESGMAKKNVDGGTRGEPRGHVFEEPEGDEREKPRAPKPMEDPSKLPELVRKGTGGDEAWGEGTSIDILNGIMYVKAPWSLQVKVKTLLNQLRQYK
jgi:hypothetical protein